jgi:hypothetical protein
VVHRTVSGAQAGPTTNSSLSSKSNGATTKIYRTVRCAKATCTNGRQRNQWATRGPRQRSVGHTGLSGVLRIVSGAPTELKVQQSGAPDKELDRAPDNYCSCLVVHRTVRCATRQKARIAFQLELQRLLAALGL